MVYNENDENIDDISSLEDTELEPVKKRRQSLKIFPAPYIS